MAVSRRLDILDFDVTPDDELPDYEPQTAPDYESEHYETPLMTYHLRQVNRKLQVFVSYGPLALSSYKVISRNFRFFTKKPEIEVIHVSSDVVAENSVASIWFDNSGPLPWRPRAHVTQAGPHGKSTHAMESKNFNDWTIAIGGITYLWTLEGRPITLVLREKNVDVVIARFTYSGYGTMAMNGAEVGELVVYRNELSNDADGIEKIMCGLMVAIVHFKKMGRQYCNDETVRAVLSSRVPLQLHGSSAVSSAHA